MTAEGPTGAPLRQQIAEAIHKVDEDCTWAREFIRCPNQGHHLTAADAVVALLNLTEERGKVFGKPATRWSGPWLPTTPPESSETS